MDYIQWNPGVAIDKIIAGCEESLPLSWKACDPDGECDVQLPGSQVHHRVTDAVDALLGCWFP